MKKLFPIFFCSFAFFLIFPPVITDAAAAEIEDHLLSGSKFAQEKNYKEAVREFETAVQIDPNNAQAHLLLGLTLTNTGDVDGSITHTKKAAELSPSYPAYYNLGLVYANQGNFAASVKAYEEAVKLNPKSYEAWHQLGKVHAASLSFDKAVEAYQHAAALNPKFPDAYQGMGSAYYWAGNLPAALQQVDELSKLKFDSHAQELERWIKDKETKKKKAAPKPAAA